MSKWIRTTLDIKRKRSAKKHTFINTHTCTCRHPDKSLIHTSHYFIESQNHNCCLKWLQKIVVVCVILGEYLERWVQKMLLTAVNRALRKWNKIWEKWWMKYLEKLMSFAEAAFILFKCWRHYFKYKYLCFWQSWQLMRMRDELLENQRMLKKEGLNKEELEKIRGIVLSRNM